MATREGIIRITADRGAFKRSMRQMASDMVSQGQAMNRALSGPMKAGIANVGKSMKNTLNEMKSGFKQIMTFGGAIAGGALLKSSVELQSMYRNIEFSLSKIPGHAMSLLEIQKIIETSADKAGQKTAVLGEAFHGIFEATGDAQFAADSIEAIGIAATASGEEVDALAGASQLMQRKFGISSNEIKEGLAAFLQLTGSGGKSLDELTGRFAVMAGEAASAGMTGVSGIQQLLGMLINLDSTIGEKADPGLKMLFQTMKAGSAQMKRLSKEAGMNFDPDMSGLEKIRELLTTKKGRVAAELVFTADARTVFDTLAKPFDEAMKEAKEKGLSNAEALDAALAEFDKNLGKSSEVTMTFEDILKKASERMRDDPSVQLRRAVDKVQRAFTQPKMVEAINKLAVNLPILADKAADFVDWIVNNPWQAAGLAGGLKVGGSFLGGALPSGGKAIAGGLSKKLAASNNKLAKSATAAAGKLGGLAGAAGGLLAAGAGGYAAGTALNKFVFEPQNEAYNSRLEDALALGGSKKHAGYLTRRVTGAGSTIEEKQAALSKVHGMIKGLPSNYVNTENIAGSFAAGASKIGSVFGLGSDSVEGPMEKFQQGMLALVKTQNEINEALKRQIRTQQKLETTTDNAGRALQKAFPDKGSARGPIETQPPTPGTDPVRG